LAQAVPTIDLIVGGHSHTALKAPERIGDTWIVQAGSNGRSVGHVELTVKDDEIATIEGRLVDLIEPGPGPQGASDNVMSRVSSYRRRIEAAFGAVVGVSSTVLGRKDDSESALGAWTTDMLRRATGANLAIFNGGGLRADLPAGSLTVGAIHGVFPFANPVAVFTMAGADVERLLLQIARSEHAADGSFVQFSGASLTWRLGPLGPEIVRADLGGQDLDVARQYRVATNSYVVEQWQRHLPVEPRDVTLLEKTVYDVAVEAVKAGPVDAPADWERRSVRLP
jgi:5'-nucleotidase